ncbi:hypothetical protein ACFV0R_07865, partial [Streptomyces sp. NPDC059578]|uniref:hypothetical protein n=1 Tax=Streptomyces sp. NPDC059578 TaxID=3346874 RepID=UPI0036A66D33
LFVDLALGCGRRPPRARARALTPAAPAPHDGQRQAGHASGWAIRAGWPMTVTGSRRSPTRSPFSPSWYVESRIFACVGLGEVIG